MNERFKQLLAQAYDEAVPETWTTLSSEQLDRIYEKFAELIVFECIKIAVFGGDTKTGKAVKEHFGVEE